MGDRRRYRWEYRLVSARCILLHLVAVRKPHYFNHLRLAAESCSDLRRTFKPCRDLGPKNPTSTLSGDASNISACAGWDCQSHCSPAAPSGGPSLSNAPWTRLPGESHSMVIAFGTDTKVDSTFDWGTEIRPPTTDAREAPHDARVVDLDPHAGARGSASGQHAQLGNRRTQREYGLEYRRVSERCISLRFVAALLPHSFSKMQLRAVRCSCSNRDF
jgi:hypothetical protein